MVVIVEQVHLDLTAQFVFAPFVLLAQLIQLAQLAPLAQPVDLVQSIHFNFAQLVPLVRPIVPAE